MRVADFASWEREFPLRYVLVRDVGDEQDREAVELLARCVDAEGLYVPREHQDRTVLVLEGCPADSPLAAALRARTGFAEPERLAAALPAAQGPCGAPRWSEAPGGLRVNDGAHSPRHATALPAARQARITAAPAAH